MSKAKKFIRCYCNTGIGNNLKILSYFSVFVADFIIAIMLNLQILDQITIKQAKWHFYLFPPNPAFQVFSLCRLPTLDIIREFKIKRYSFVTSWLDWDKKTAYYISKNAICDSWNKLAISFSTFIGFKILNSTFRWFWKITTPWSLIVRMYQKKSKKWGVFFLKNNQKEDERSLATL